MSETHTRETIEAIRYLRNAICVPSPPVEDASGVFVECLTESVMGVTAGLCKIADAINRLAEAVESK